MSRLRPGRYVILSAFVLLAPVGLAVARPHSAACAVLGAMPLEHLPDGTLADAGLSGAERRAVIEQRAEALRRIAATFGPARAHPIVVHISKPGAMQPFHYNSFGSTDFLPGRTCIVLGPDGRNVDVYAHELFHAEIAHRAGFWQRWRQMPVWFDEGMAMQVDYRSDFVLPQRVTNAGGHPIWEKATAASFFAVPPDQLTRNYAQARQVIAAWLDRTGRKNFYSRLSEMRRGKNFDEIWAE